MRIKLANGCMYIVRHYNKNYMSMSVTCITLHDYRELFIKRYGAKEDLELVTKSLKPPTRPPLPRTEIYLDGCYTCSGDQLAYVVSPLYISLKREWLNVFQYLLALCPTIVNKLLPTVASHEWVSDNCSNSETLLHLACQKELVKIIQDLLDRGASTEIRGCNVGTPLHVAAKSGNLRATELLLDSGADIEARDNNGNTPLLTAVAKDMLASVQLLLERGADITAVSYFGDVYNIAIRSYAHKVLTYLCEFNAFQMFSSNSPSILAPLLSLAAILNKSPERSTKVALSVIFERLVNDPNCPPCLRVDAGLISASCTEFSSKSVEKFRNALRLKQDFQTGPAAVTPTSSWYA